MITGDNLKYLLENLDKKEIEDAFDSCSDYVLIFNVGAYSSLIASDYCPNLEQLANDSGNLFIDKCDFLLIYKESGANNKHIEKLI